MSYANLLFDGATIAKNFSDGMEIADSRETCYFLLRTRVIRQKASDCWRSTDDGICYFRKAYVRHML